MLNNGVALGLDGLSLLTDFVGPETQYAKLATGLGLSTASTINSSASGDVTGAGLGMTSYLKTTTELAATSAGWKWAKWIPGASLLLDGASLAHDYKQLIKDYRDCMEHY